MTGIIKVEIGSESVHIRTNAEPEVTESGALNLFYNEDGKLVLIASFKAWDNFYLIQSQPILTTEQA